MPPHIAFYDDDETPADSISLEIQRGQTSPVFVRKIINDKDAAFGDTTTAINQKLILLASVAGSAFASEGRPILDERWTRARITHYLIDGVWTTAGATSTQPWGTNAELPINDLAPQEGARIEFQVFAPGVGTVAATKIQISNDGNRASSPLARFIGLASGSGIVPPDRASGLRALLRGGEITADDSDTISIANGSMVYEGTIITFPAVDIVFSLLDGNGVALGAGQSYRVTLSRPVAGSPVTVTKAPKETADFPEKPEPNIFVRSLIVTSADGVAVSVSAASLTGSPTYAGYLVRAGAGLTILVSAGDGLISPADLRQYLSHETIANVTANSTNRVWRNAAGDTVVTLTDVEPEFGADLLALAITDADSVTEIVDVRRFIHRAWTLFPLEFSYRAVWSTLAVPSHGLAMLIAHDDLEIEEIIANLTDTDGAWTGGAIVPDIYVFPPGAPVPYPAGGVGVGGVSLFTSSATDDQRPSIAFDATDLQSVTHGHEVRRIAKGSRILLSIAATVAAPAPEFDQELRITLIARRYR